MRQQPPVKQPQVVRQQPPVGRQQAVRQQPVKQLLTAVSVSLLMLEPQAVRQPPVGRQQAVRQPPVGRQQAVRQPPVGRPQDVLSVFRLLIFPWLLATRSTVQLMVL